MIKKIGLLMATAFTSMATFAADPSTGPDLSPLTDSVNFDSVLVAIMAIAATLVTLYAGYAGVRWVLRMVRGA